MKSVSVRIARLLVLLFTFNGSGLAAGAAISIPSLRHDRVLGSLPSTSIMRERVRNHEARLERAAALIGLSPAEFAAWHTQILTSKTLSYVEIPQHLDAMTGYSLRRGVYVIRDLDIPKSFGWEVDLNEPGAHRLLALYLPADCGNLSLLKKQPRQSAAATSPPTPTPTPTATPAPTPTPTLAPTPTPTVSAPVVTPTPVVTPAPVVHHHVTIFPYLGAAVIGAAIYLIVHHCTCPTPPSGYTYTSGYCKSHLRGI